MTAHCKRLQSALGSHGPVDRPDRRIGIEDVAAAANVSVATVSRALRHLPNVAESTRERVIDIAEVDGLPPRPCGIATGHRAHAGRSRWWYPISSSWYFSTVIAGAEAVCAEAGYECLVLSVGTIAGCNQLLDEPNHLERRTDGLVLVNIPASEAQAESLRRRDVALSTVGTRTRGHPAVLIDDVSAGRMATEHLIELGHERIGLISGEHDDPMNFAVPLRRQEGFAAALADAGLEFDEALVRSGNFGIDGGQEAMSALLDRPDPPTAVFAMSDEMAFGALMALTERGLRPAVDVSLIGVDDHDVARVVGLSTVRQRVASQGAAAMRALLARLADPSTPETIVDSPLELVVRQTTAQL